MKAKFNRKTAGRIMASITETDQRQSAKRIVKGSEREYLKKIHEQQCDHRKS